MVLLITEARSAVSWKARDPISSSPCSTDDQQMVSSLKEHALGLSHMLGAASWVQVQVQVCATIDPIHLFSQAQSVCTDKGAPKGLTAQHLRLDRQA